MYLKKLEVIGFKSFGEATTVLFQPGITAIVGPNGCGKSNIVDAILWTLGEQSTKTLRSEKMEDVIFNGTETRKPLGLCESILTIGDVSGEISGQFGDFQEIAIRRRLFRSGESEYLINKIPCRLKDIRDLLIDTGAGHKGHTIIEQGKVDQLLNASPDDRRELIEETAGITKYKLRKAEAERKLESTRQNLLRVTDIINEVQRQINALNRQVKKTQTYQTLKDEAQQLDLKLLVSEYRMHQDSLAEVSLEKSNLSSRDASHRAELGRVETELTTLKTGAVDKETALASLRQSVHDVQMMIQRQENRIELLQSQIQSWEEQRTKLLQEQSRIEESISETEKLLETTLRRETELTETRTERQTRLEEQDTALNQFNDELSRQEATLEENKNQQFEALAHLTEIKNQLASLDSRKKEIQRIQEKGQSECSSVERQMNQVQQSLQQEETLLKELSERLSGQEGLRSLLDETLGQKQNALQTQAEEILGIREKMTLSQARLASLEENEKSLTTSQAGIRNLIFERSNSQDRLHGIVADLVEVSKTYELAIEAVLAEQLQGLLIEDHATIREILLQLKSGPRGRGLFIPKSPRLEARPVFPTSDDYSGVIGPALEQVTAKPGYEDVARALLGHILCVRDLDAAFTLWNGNSIDYTIVTMDGDVLEPSGLLWGGQASGSNQGLLETRRLVHEVGKETHSHESRLTHAESLRSTLTAEIHQLAQEQQELREQHQNLDREVSDQRQKTALVAADQDHLKERRALLRAEHEQEALEYGRVEEDLNRTQQQLKNIQQDQTRIDTELGLLQQKHRDQTEKRELLRSEVTQLKIDVTSMVQQEEALSKEKIRLVNEQDALRDQKQRNATEMANLESKSRAAHQDTLNTEGELTGLADQLTKALGHLSVQTESYTTELDHIKQVEIQLSEVRAELTRLEKLLQEQEIRQAELKLRLTHLTEQASTQHQISLEEMSEAPVESIPDDSTREAMGFRLNELRTKLDQLGPVNLAAIDEYKELEERHRFLTTQEADLKQSVDDLHAAISKISRTTKDLFLAAYSELRVKFREVFQEFFVGGQADLILLDENNPLDSGIEIMAQPPGKRLRSISLLSGGEKALTAIALLFSSFLIHPSPFCILDEIDAPLDDENIRRFLTVLRKMLNHSQFLIITHNKRTMEQADALYGVTMEEPGVSKLVSVRVESNGNGHAPSPTAPIGERSSPTATA